MNEEELTGTAEKKNETVVTFTEEERTWLINMLENVTLQGNRRQISVILSTIDGIVMKLQGEGGADV